MILINFKTYENGTGSKALELAKVCDRASKFSDVKISIAVQPFDLKEISRNVSIPVFAQHVDPISPGAHTGWLLPEAAKLSGAFGTLINHSERRIPIEDVENVIKICKAVGLATVVCVSSPEEATKVDKFNPDYIAIEPPELIGSGVSVSEAEPDIITRTVDSVEAPVLCGAGITNGDDVKKAIDLGATGVLIASAVVKSYDPMKSIKDMLNAFKL